MAANPRTKSKSTSTVTPTTAEPLSAWQQLRADAENFRKEFAEISPQRTLAAWVLSVGAGVLVGTAFSSLLDYIVIATAMLSGSAFLATVIYVLGIILAVYAGVHTFNTVFSYMVSSRCTHHIGLVKGLFTRRSEVPHA